MDGADWGILLSCLLSSASLYDRQTAIPHNPSYDQDTTLDSVSTANLLTINAVRCAEHRTEPSNPGVITRAAAGYLTNAILRV